MGLGLIGATRMAELGRARRKSNTEPMRHQDPGGTRRDILEVASREFARNGLSGARVDEIAAHTRSSKRMIYYYFGDKEGLYLRVLEDAYRLVREGEAKLDVEGLSPIEALRQLVEFTFDHHREHEEFIRLVMIENIHGAEYLNQSDVVRGLNASAIDHVTRIYESGVAGGDFRPGIDPVELHWLISSLCFFNVSNRATFSRIFGRDFGSDEMQDRLRRNAVDTVLRFAVVSEAGAPELPAANKPLVATATSGRSR